MGAFQERFRTAEIIGILVLLLLWIPGPFLLRGEGRGGYIYLCAVAAVELIGLGIWFILRQTRRYRRCTVPAKAKVLFNVRSRMRDKKEAFQPVLTYQVEGEWLRAAGNGRPMPLMEGDCFQICYNPEVPEEFRFAQEKPSPLQLCVGPVLIALGVLCCIAGILIWFSKAGAVPAG